MAEKTAAGLVAHARAQLGLPYVYAFWGNALTLDNITWSQRTYRDVWSSSGRFAERNARARGQIGKFKRAYDCAGLIKSYWMQENPTAIAKYVAKYDKSADGLYRCCKVSGKIGALPKDTEGVLVFIYDKARGGMRHVGLCDGKGRVIEAQGFSTGVVERPLSAGSWTHWGLLDWLEYPSTHKPEKPAIGPQASTTQAQRDFIDRVGNLALKYSVPAKILPSLTIAQAILESGWGGSRLNREGNNFFGIKAGSSWKGDRLNCKTFEHIGGKDVPDSADFRAYPSLEASVEDHAKVLGVLERYKAVRGEKDYKKACRAVLAAGYATKPSYADELIQIIEQFGLTVWDAKTAPPTPGEDIKIGDRVRFRQTGIPYLPYLPGAITIPSRLEGQVFTVNGTDIKNGAPCARLAEIVSWCVMANLEKVRDA